MGTLWRALLEGFGWHVGREAAKEALDHVEKALAPEPEATPLDPKALEAERNARAKAEAREVKERAAAKKREDKELDAEMRALKRRVGR
jgi:proteasome assembly chaperone (PAC2) family protein